MTVGDAFHDLVTVLPEIGVVRNSVFVSISEDITGAMACEIGARPARGFVLWRRRDERECHIFRAAVTVRCERIATILAPVAVEATIRA